MKVPKGSKYQDRTLEKKEGSEKNAKDTLLKMAYFLNWFYNGFKILLTYKYYFAINLILI